MGASPPFPQIYCFCDALLSPLLGGGDEVLEPELPEAPVPVPLPLALSPVPVELPLVAPLPVESLGAVDEGDDDELPDPLEDVPDDPGAPPAPPLPPWFRSHPINVIPSIPARSVG